MVSASNTQSGLKLWGLIIMSPGFSEEKQSLNLHSDKCTLRVVGVDPSDAENDYAKTQKIALKLISLGVQMIELTGLFGVKGTYKVIEAISKVKGIQHTQTIPIGSTCYGPECRQNLVSIWSTGPKKWAYFFKSPEFISKKVTLKSEKSEVVLVGFDPDKLDKVTEIASDILHYDVEMIELCGGFGPKWIADLTQVAKSLSKLVPIGGVFYSPEYANPMLNILSGNSKV